jgi:hypothetical protein
VKAQISQSEEVVEEKQVAEIDLIRSPDYVGCALTRNCAPSAEFGWLWWPCSSPPPNHSHKHAPSPSDSGPWMRSYALAQSTFVLRLCKGRDRAR